MKKLVPGIVAILFSVSAHAGGHGLVSKPSRHSVDETISRLETVVKSTR